MDTTRTFPAALSQPEANGERTAWLAPTALLIVDRRGTVLGLDPTAQQWLGCTPDQALEGPVTRFIPPGAWAELLRHVDTADPPAEAGRLPPPALETTACRTDGAPLGLTIQLTPLSGPGQPPGPAHFVLLMSDPMLQRGLAPAGHHPPAWDPAAWLDSLPVAACLAENDRIVHANARCAEMVGLAAHELRGRSASGLVRAPMRHALQQHLAHAQAGEAPLPPFRVQLDRADGSAREADLLCAALPAGGARSQVPVPVPPQVQMVWIDLTLRRHERAEIEQSQLELRQLSASLVEAREAERRRIARELHDELGQQLSALKMELSTLRGNHDTRVRAGRIDGMLQMIDETVGSVRRIATDLRPLMLDDLGLSAALDWLAREFSRRMGIQVKLEMDDNAPPVPERASIAVYRMVQEALTNIARHARATRAHIEIRQAAGELLLTVDDDGVGLPAMAMHRAGSHGLVGMRERCHMLGGELQIGASPLGGSRVGVRLPLQAAAEPLLERRRSDRSGVAPAPGAAEHAPVLPGREAS